MKLIKVLRILFENFPIFVTEWECGVATACEWKDSNWITWQHVSLLSLCYYSTYLFYFNFILYIRWLHHFDSLLLDIFKHNSIISLDNHLFLYPPLNNLRTSNQNSFLCPDVESLNDFVDLNRNMLGFDCE